MHKYRFLFLSSFLSSLLLLQGCARTGDDIWDDTKSAGRHMNRGLRALGGKHGDSRQIRCREDFECVDDENGYPTDNQMQDCDYCEDRCGPHSDFVPLEDQANEMGMAEMMSRPPRETPGEAGSSLPSIEAFRDPNTIPRLVGLFRPIYFEYDSSLIKGQQNLQTLHDIANYMRLHPGLYVFVEGHTDERGPQAYNLALGSRRSNGIRNILISEGVNPDNLFTISYGKERPVILERHEEGWAKNRRAEFKVYER